MKNGAKYNTETRRGTYSDKIFHGELLPGATIVNDSPTAYGQKLAGERGTKTAKKSLSKLRKK